MGAGVSVAERAELDEKAVAGLVGWYERNDLPAPFRALDPRVVRTAKRLTDGNLRRCIVEDDGSVLICNSEVWT